MKLRKLHHAVLRVRDLDRSVAFYRDVLGFRLVTTYRGMMAFLSLGESHHDLALMALGESAPPPDPRRVGLYHLAFEVDRLGDLADARRRLGEAGALGGASDHGVSKSLYGADPDGNEFELLWNVPPAEYGDRVDAVATILPLDLEGEIARRGAEAPSGGE
ncbi:MAG: VOC family protein [Candidatus Limnocylindria bacterium]